MTRDEWAAKYRSEYEYRLDVVLTLDQAIKLRHLLSIEPELAGLYESLQRGIVYAWEFCADQALKQSIMEGSK